MGSHGDRVRRRRVLVLDSLEGRCLLSSLAPPAEVQHSPGVPRTAPPRWATERMRAENTADAGVGMRPTPAGVGRATRRIHPRAEAGDATGPAAEAGHAGTSRGIRPRVAPRLEAEAARVGATTVAVASRHAVDARHAPGFIGPAAGAPAYRKYGPPQMRDAAQLNQPLGQAKADRLARALGLDKRLCFTEAQYQAFISGQGANGSGDPASAKLVDESVAILTNSNANPMIRVIDGKPTQIVLGSYGLMVDPEGWLQSDANLNAPTRQFNALLGPGNYIDTWAAANGATASIRMLRRSAYTIQAPYGFAAQQLNGPAELAIYINGRRSAVTGLAMVPPLWEVNFALIYVLNPKVAAQMPAYWAPIPWPVVAALDLSPQGRVRYSEFASYFGASPNPSAPPG